MDYQDREVDVTAPPTPGQLRAARGYVGWSVRDLSKLSRLSRTTITAYEADDAGSRRESLLLLLRALFEREGVEFVEIDGKPGVLFGPKT